MTALRKPSYVAGLDILRFASALFVLLYHLGLASWAGDDQNIGDIAKYRELLPYTWMGWVGVEVFFVISGFVIAFSSVGRSPFDFAKHRAIRLYPSAWICASITLLIAAYVHLVPRPHLLQQWAGSLTLIPLINPRIDSVYWTLNVEIVFYAVIAVAIARRAKEQLDSVFFVLALVSFVYDFGSVFLYHDFALRNMWNLWFELSLLQYGCCFSLGGAIWATYHFGPNTSRRLTIVLSLVGACLEVYLKALFNAAFFSVNSSRLLPDFIFTGCIIIFVVSIRVNNLIPTKIKGWCRLVGVSTYPLYLVHNLVGRSLLRLIIPIVGRWPALVIVTAAMVMLAFATLPLERWIASRLRVALRMA